MQSGYGVKVRLPPAAVSAGVASATTGTKLGPTAPAGDGTVGIQLLMDRHFSLKLLAIHIDPSWSIGDVSACLDAAASLPYTRMQECRLASGAGRQQCCQNMAMMQVLDKVGILWPLGRDELIISKASLTYIPKVWFSWP